MRRIVTTLIALLFVGALVAGCSAGGDDAMADAEAAAPADSPVEPDEDASGADDSGEAERSITSVTQANPASRQIIHTIDLAIETDNVSRAAARAVALAEAAGGFVAQESTRDDDSATLTLRVPVARHSSIVADLEKIGEVRERNRSAEDVTAEVVDIEARVASQRRSIERIRVLLDQAADLGDVVRIESELARREADLDSLLQRQQQLSSLTSLATVTVTFYRVEQEPVETEAASLGFLSGLSNGWSALVTTATVAGAIVGALLPFAVVAAIVGVPAWLLWRRYRTAHRSPGIPAPTTAAPSGEGA